MFDLSKPEDQEKLRLRAAGALKALILARARSEPEFLTPERRSSWWKPKEQDPVPEFEKRSKQALLKEAHNRLQRFQQIYSGELDSIPAPFGEVEERADAIRCGVLDFVQTDLAEFERTLRAGQTVDWSKVADWDKLPQLRTLLNRLPHEGNRDVDGPMETGRFRYQGELFDGCPSKPWLLINFLWNRNSRSAPFRDLADPVWGNRNEEITEAMFGSARRDANKWLKHAGIPFQVRGKSEVAMLVGTIPAE